MFQIHSVTGRIFIGVTIGFVLGALSILALPVFGFPLFSMLGLGSLIMFVLMGLTLGLVGIFDHHPLFGFKMRWWLRGTVIGGAFMLMFILLSYSSLEVIMQSTLVSWTGLTSPFWAMLDGITLGLLMAWAETRFAGEGSALPLK